MPAPATSAEPISLWQLARTGPWLRGLAAAACASMLCSAAGMWQWERREERVARNQLVLDNYDATPQTLETTLTTSTFPASKTWQRVTVSGTYQPSGQLLVRSRPLDGRPGSYVLTPFRTDGGVTLYINRGWMPIDEPATPPPSGTTTLTPHLRPAEPPDGRTPPPGHTFRIIPGDYAPDLPRFEDSPSQPSVVSSAFGQLGPSEPGATGLLRRLPRPEISEGSHLSYTFQWFVFALGCFGAWFLALRRSLDDRPQGPNTSDGSSPTPVAAKPDKSNYRTLANRRSRSRDEDMDAEDAAIDAQLGHNTPPGS